MADLLRKYKSLYSSTANTFSTGTGVTITPASVVGLPTDTEITLTFDRVNSGGTSTPSLNERIIGTISGANFVVRTSPSSGRGADSTTEQTHTSPVVEMIWNAKDWNDMIEWAVTEHAQDGSHKKVTGLTNNTPITMKNSGGTARSLININASDVTEVGNTSQTTKIKSGSSTTNGHTVPNASDDTVALIAATQTLTNKRITKRTSSTASASAPTPDADTTDVYILTALAEAATFGAPSGTPTQGQTLIIRIKDNGTARALSFNAIYRFSSDLAAPTTTVISKTFYLGFIYNSTDTKWDCVAQLNNF